MWALNATTRALTRKAEGDQTQTQRGGDVMMVTAITVMYTVTGKDHHGTPAPRDAARGKGLPLSPEFLEETQPSPHLNFRFLAPKL